MKRMLAFIALALPLTACVIAPGHVAKQSAPGPSKKQAAPGQVMHETGCNPASGKCKQR